MFDLHERKKGYKSPQEVRKNEKEITSFFKDEKDQKTFKELLGIAEKTGWSKSSLWRYLERMVKERKIIKEARGQKERGAVYRCNLVELMQLDHFAYLDKIREFCSKKGLSLFYDEGSVNCTILGIPSEGLTDYEQLVARAIVKKLSSSWLLLYSLRGIVSQRLLTERDLIGVYDMLSLYRHEFNEILNNILEHPNMNASKVKEFLEHLKKSVISWTGKEEIPCSFRSLDNLIERYDLEEIEKTDKDIDYPPLEFKDENVKLFQDEILALTVTRNMMESKEFWQRIENWLRFHLLEFFEIAQEFNFNKAQEIDEVALEIFKTISIRRWYLRPRLGPLVLRKEEKERLLNWDLLLNRYGEEDTKFILKLVGEATLMYEDGCDKKDVRYVIAKKTDIYLKQKGLIDLYVKEKF